MEIKLTPEESEKHFFDALCNGLSYFQSYGKIEYSDAEYRSAKLELQAQIDKSNEPSEAICYEDVYMQMLRRGNKLEFECSEDPSLSCSITLKDVHERVQLTPIEHLTDMIAGNDDAVTADIILQTVFLKEVVFS